MIYLDNNATTAPSASVIEAVRAALHEGWGNPSSVHPFGALARDAVESARSAIARAVGATAREVVFTSGGTESCNLALLGSLGHEPGRHLVVTAPTEHAAVRECALALESGGWRAGSDRGEVVWVDLDSDGRVDLGQLVRLLGRRASEVAVVSLMWANNETGIIQPVEQIATVCREHGVRFHTDATQCLGRIPIDVAKIGCDLLSVSAHKAHGPKGIGALYCRRGVSLASQVLGGPQERGRRGGTENVAGLCGFGAACAEAAQWLARADTPTRQLAQWRDAFESAVVAAVRGAVVIGQRVPRLWNTSLIAFPRLQSEALLVELGRIGVAASAGAACSSGSLDPSPVLLAMGIDREIAHGAVRFSMSRLTTQREMDDAASRVVQAVQSVARAMP
jgi:cysteine desulfurase